MGFSVTFPTTERSSGEGDSAGIKEKVDWFIRFHKGPKKTLAESLQNTKEHLHLNPFDKWAANLKHPPEGCSCWDKQTAPLGWQELRVMQEKSWGLGSSNRTDAVVTGQWTWSNQPLNDPLSLFPLLLSVTCLFVHFALYQKTNLIGETWTNCHFASCEEFQQILGKDWVGGRKKIAGWREDAVIVGVSDP